VSTVHDLLRDYQHVIADLTLVMGSKGVFDVTVDGELLYSKHAMGRHAEPGEVLALFRRRIAPGVGPYER
jgi:predicted Rdx family selenoprotein